MQLGAEQKAEIEAQKEQCVFCHIACGKIPSIKVYEDKTLIAILDINPATEGHMLIVPKEHYPILPLVPPEMFKEIFTKTKHIAHAIKEALLVKDAILFVANGGAAGQQVSHFLLHIIPKDSGSDASGLSLPQKEKGADYADELHQKAAPFLTALCDKNLVQLGYKQRLQETPRHAPQELKFIKETEEDPSAKASTKKKTDFDAISSLFT